MSTPRLALPPNDWPARDRARWEAALRPGDQFDPSGKAAAWRPATRDLNERCYGHWLAFLRDAALLDPDLDPPLRCSPTNLAAYLDALARQGLASMTVLKRIHGLNGMLRALCPEADLTSLDGLEGRLKRSATPIRDKESRLVSPQVLFAGAMGELHRLADAPSLRDAQRYRDALIVAFLVRRPIRLSNLTAIALGRQLGQRNGNWRFHFEALELKLSPRPLRFPLPQALREMFEGYLALQRPRLLQGRSLDRLWVSTRATALVDRAVYQGVCAVTERIVGHRINPHLFRDIVATFISEEAPEDRSIVADILGHTTLATSQTYYDHASSLRAQQKLSDIVDRIAWGDDPLEGES